MNAQNKNIAVVGAGRWGKNLVRNFHELGVLRTVVDVDTETDFCTVLRDPDIQAVAIATPAATHYALVKEALDAGKDVFVEKPLALTLNEGKDLVRMAEEMGRVLMVDHLLHYHPAVIKLKELIDQGTLGKLQYIYSNRLNIGQLRSEENILWSFAPHDISLILGLLGQEPSTVRVFGEAYVQQGIYDTTITELSFKDRLKAHIFVSWLHPYKEQRLVVIGSKNMAVFNDMEEDKLTLYPHRIEWVKKIPVAAKAEREVIPINNEEPLKAACRHFLECMQKRTRPRTDGREALAVLKILTQAEEFLNENLYPSYH